MLKRWCLVIMVCFKQGWIDQVVILKVSLHCHWRMNRKKAKVDLEEIGLEGFAGIEGER